MDCINRYSDAIMYHISSVLGFRHVEIQEWLDAHATDTTSLETVVASLERYIAERYQVSINIAEFICDLDRRLEMYQAFESFVTAESAPPPKSESTRSDCSSCYVSRSRCNCGHVSW